MVVSDSGILKIHNKDKRQALELLYERYKKYVYTIAFHYVGTKEDALDITQEVFLKLFKVVGELKDEFSLLPYIKKITINKCLNHIRDRKEAVSLNKTTEEGEEMHCFLASEENTENSVHYRDTRRILEKAIQTLPSLEKMAIILRHVNGMKYEEIAKTMNLPLGTVKTYLYRGRNYLKELLKNQGIWEVSG